MSGRNDCNLGLLLMQREFYDRVYQPDHQFGYGGDPAADIWRERIETLGAHTRCWLEERGISRMPEARVLEVGCGMAYLHDVHPGWHGLEYSQSAVDRARLRFGLAKRIMQGDAQALPYANEYFTAVFTWAVLEHVPDPGEALKEVDRVLCPGGTALIAPAWNCRPWTVKKLRERSLAELTISERFERLSILIRERILVRALASLPGRVRRELHLRAMRPLALQFRRLEPRWDLIERLGHVADDDAVASIDPHAAVVFFASRGYEVASHKGIKERLSARAEPVIVIKPRR